MSTVDAVRVTFDKASQRVMIASPRGPVSVHLMDLLTQIPQGALSVYVNSRLLGDEKFLTARKWLGSVANRAGEGNNHARVLLNALPSTGPT